MADRRRAGLWVVGFVAVAGTVGGLAWVNPPKSGVSPPSKTTTVAEKTELAADLARGDLQGLADLGKRVLAPAKGPIAAYTRAEGDEAIATLGGLRTGFEKFGPEGRSSALAISGKILERFGADPAPACWAAALAPSHEILKSGLADTTPSVRAAALVEVGKLWSWVPGLTPTPAEEEALDSFKQGLLTPTVRRLTDRDASARAAAVTCLSKLPINDAAAPAVACLADPDQTVRQQVLIGFAARPALLTEEQILPRLYDPSKIVVLIAERVLKARGLSDDQVELGRLVFHPRASKRASAIPLLPSRTDIDPVVWLLLLSHDREESVRAKALEALAGRDTPEAGRRLREMAQNDESARIRAAAAKVAPASETTAALPPLPGSPNLNPRAN